MSLLIWLPLNGDLKNKGLSKTTFSFVNSSNGLTFSSINGKTSAGMCRRTVVNTPDYIKSNENILLDKDFSMACWCKPTTAGAVDSANGIITNHNHSNCTGAGITLKYVSATDCRISCNTGDGTNRTYYTYYGTTNIYGAWHHLCLTYHKATTTYKLYVDGVCEKTFTYGNAAQESLFTLFNWSLGHASSGSYRPVCDLNDVRVYDHCLSLKEIEEISQGLIAHYPLRNKVNPNLITTMKAGGRTTLVDEYTLEANFAQNADTYGYFVVSPALELDKTYTLSFKVKNLPDGAVWGWRLWNNSNYVFDVTENGYYTYTFKPDASLLPTGYSLSEFLFDDGGRTNPANTVTFSHFKIEEGPKATFWVPHTASSKYNDGYAKIINTIDECSGYGYNLTVVGDEIFCVEDSIRNTHCISIPNGQTSYLKGDSVFFPYDKVTINCWFKSDSGVSGQGGYHIPFSGENSFFEMSIYSGGQFRSGLHVNGSRSVMTVPSKNLSDGNWHMITLKYDGAEIKRYVDGEIISEGTVAITGSLSGGNGLLTLGHYGTSTSYGNKQSYMSDVRLYATALSDEAIFGLYQTSISIDNLQNIHAHEFIEIDENDFRENGTVNFDVFENKEDNKCSIYDSLLTAAYFIEK